MPVVRLWSPVQLFLGALFEKMDLWSNVTKGLSDDIPDNAMPLIMMSVGRGYSSLLRYLNAHFILLVISYTPWRSSPVQ